ncbi:hypothetical protein [Nostoc sp.]|uniref:hypothetical protein n=1 Tax=Nostoc sp. TaxID=1180 RepID=UPI002FF57E37
MLLEIALGGENSSTVLIDLATKLRAAEERSANSLETIIDGKEKFRGLEAVPRNFCASIQISGIKNVKF